MKPQLAGVNRGAYVPAMNATLDSVFSNALELPAASRLSLVQRITATLRADPEIEREQLTVAEARLDGIRTGAVRGVSGEDAIRRVRLALSAAGKSHQIFP